MKKIFLSVLFAIIINFTLSAYNVLSLNSIWYIYKADEITGIKFYDDMTYEELIIDKKYYNYSFDENAERRKYIYDDEAANYGYGRDQAFVLTLKNFKGGEDLTIVVYYGNEFTPTYLYGYDVKIGKTDNDEDVYYFDKM